MEKIERILSVIDQIFWSGIPYILKGLIIAIVVIVLFKKQIKKHTWVFYIYPGVMMLACITYGIISLINDKFMDKFWESALGKVFEFFYDQIPLTVIGVGFIIIVMFAGVLPKTKFVRDVFVIRKELSIIGGALLIGHAFFRLSTALMVWKEDLNIFLFIAYGILGIILLVFITIPWITSFSTIRKKMAPKAWKKLQTRTAVPLLVLMLLFGITLNVGWAHFFSPDWLQPIREVKQMEGGDAVDNLFLGYRFAGAQLSIRIYLALLISYICLRYKKKKAKKTA